MTIYPIVVRAKMYRGSNKRKIEQMVEMGRLAQRVEKYINDKAQGHESMKFDYAWIASDLGESTDNIRALLSPVGGGHNGLIVCSREYWEKNHASE